MNHLENRLSLVKKNIGTLLGMDTETAAKLRALQGDPERLSELRDALAAAFKKVKSEIAVGSDPLKRRYPARVLSFLDHVERSLRLQASHLSPDSGNTRERYLLNFVSETRTRCLGMIRGGN